MNKIYFILTISCLLSPVSFICAQPPNAFERKRAAQDEISRLKSGFTDKNKSQFRLDEETQELRGAHGFRSAPQRGRDPRDVASDFIKTNRKLFFNPPEEARTYAPSAFGPAGDAYIKEKLNLELEQDHKGPGERNILFKERYNGIPVEFSRASAHLSPANEVFAAFSSLDSGVVGIEPKPKILETEALATVVRDWAKGRMISGIKGELVYLPKRFEEGLDPRKKGKARLAWKFKFRWHGPSPLVPSFPRSLVPSFGLWSVYVDAHSGEIVGAVNDLRSAAAKLRHFQRDPNEGGNGQLGAIRGLEVFQRKSDGTSFLVLPTAADGSYNAGTDYDATQSLFAVLRTTYAVVVDEKNSNAIYMKGGADWRAISVSSSSVSPYPVNSKLTQSFTCPANTVFSSVRFNQFDVGYQASGETERFTQEDLDFVEVLQPVSGRRLAAYSGQNKTAFASFPSSGTQIDARLVSNSTNGPGNETGYKVNQINCLIQAADVTGSPEIRFFDSDGVITYDGAAAVNMEDVIRDVALDPSGRIVAVGYSSRTANNSEMVVWRFNADGTSDRTFASNGVYVYDDAANLNDYGYALAFDSLGRIIVAGTSYNGANYDLAVWRLNSGGSLDNGFSGDGYFTAAGAGGGFDSGYDVVVDSSNKIVVAGTSSNGVTLDMAIWKIKADGSALDTTFATDAVTPGRFLHNNAAGGGGADAGYGIVLDNSGKIIVAGGSLGTLGIFDADLAVWMVLSTGGVDSSFGTNGVFVHNNAAGGNNFDQGNDVVLDNSGRIIVAGTSFGTTFDLAVWRLNSNGSLDSSFGTSGVFTHNNAAGGNAFDWGWGITKDSSGRIIVVGQSSNGTDSDMAVWRLNSGGSLDSGFGVYGVFTHNNAAGGGGPDGGYRAAIDSSGRIIVGGASDRDDTATIGYDAAIWKIETIGGLNFTAANALKHVGEIYGYFADDNERYGQVLSTRPAVLHVNFGNSLVGAFFDPEMDIFLFGEGGDLNSGRNTALATDVIFHEYTHLVVDHIYNIANFGQDGAMSEALSDFFALDALASVYPAHAKTKFGEWAFPDQPDQGLYLTRELFQSPKKKYPNDWKGEVHDDSLIVSGSLWDLRASLGSSAAKNLVRDALFYFPDSFQALYEALITTSAGRYDASINAAFGAHGIGSWAFADSDSYEPNDGFQTASSMTASLVYKGTIYPAGDVDFFRFTAGAGPVQVNLKRPFDSTSYLYYAYGFQVFDVNRQIVASVLPETVFDLPGSGDQTNSAVGDQTASASFTLDQPKALYIAVSSPFLESSNDPTNSQTLQYELAASFGASVGVGSSGLSASMTDQRTIKFSAVNLTGFKSYQDISQTTEATIDHLDILDHNMIKLANASGAALTITTTTVLPGKLEANVALPANFFDLYPSAGTIYLEVFVRNPLGNVYSLGLSNAVKIFSSEATLKAYNNIFNPVRGQKAVIRYTGSGAGHYRLAVYTVNGDLVKMLADRYEDAGLSSVDWDGKNGVGETVASGIYLVHLEGPDISKTQKVVVVK